MTFAQLEDIGSETPMPRENFAISRDPYSTVSAYIFGGYYVNVSISNITFYNEIWKWELSYAGSSSYHWTKLDPYGIVPSARSFACLNPIQYQNNGAWLFAFGGSTSVPANGVTTPVSDSAYLYNPFYNYWHNITADAISAGLTPRTGCACASVIDKAYIFGGLNETGSLLNEMWVYNLGNGVFSIQTPMGGTGRWLAGASTMDVWQNQWIFIKGGVTKYPIIQNYNLNLTQSDITDEFWAFDRRNDNWTLITANDNIFPKRFGNSISSRRVTNQIFSFGGNILNGTHANTTIPPFNPASFNFSYTDCPTTQIGFTVSEVWTYTPGANVWQNVTVQPQTNTQYVPPIANGQFLFIGQCAYIFGGVILQCPFVESFPNVNVSRACVSSTRFTFS